MPLPSHSPLVLERLCVHARDVLGVDRAAIYARDPEAPAELTPLAAVGASERAPGETIRASRGLANLAISSGEPLYVRDRELRELRATASAPMPVAGEVRGALSVSMRSEALRLGLGELELLGGLADLAGTSLERGDLSDGGSVEAVRRLTAELERAEPQTARHSDDVSRLAVQVGSALGLSGVELLELELGSRLHDVGKLRVPPAILRKPGPLSDSEREVMRLHALWGAELVAGIPGLEAVALIVRFHHERFDGHGYPDGLAGERIPLASRVLAACDAYGAMTSDRPYRRALDPDAALRELDRCAGVQFDPRVSEEVRRCLRPAGSLADHLDHEALWPAAVELGVEDLLPRP